MPKKNIICRRWDLLDTKYVKSKLFYDRDELFLFGFTIILNHDGSAIRKRGIYLSLFGFNFQIYKPQ